MSVAISQLVPASVVAETLHVTENTVLRWAKEGRLPSIRLSPKAIRFNLDAVMNRVMTEPAAK